MSTENNTIDLRIETADRIKDIEARALAATPGPWMWDLSSCNHRAMLCTTHSGRYYVMAFQRWGTQSAGPAFQKFQRYEGPVTERGGMGMKRCDAFASSLPGKEHHEGFDDYIDHPDAIFIEHSKADIDFLLSVIHCQNTELSALRERCAAAEADLLDALSLSESCDFALCHLCANDTEDGCAGRMTATNNPCDATWRGPQPAEELPFVTEKLGQEDKE